MLLLYMQILKDLRKRYIVISSIAKVRKLCETLGIYVTCFICLSGKAVRRRV